MTSPKLIKQTFTYNSGSDAQTTMNSNPDGVTLPSGTITVASTTGFTSSGIINVYSVTGSNTYSLQTINYTGKTSTTFTGCTGGTGTVYNYSQYPNPTIVTQASNSAILISNWVAPPGVKWVWVTGCGGGGGGGSGASVSSTNNSYPLFIWCLAGGGGGGQAAVTSTHVVSVVPGTSYAVSVGLGGVGATPNLVWNGAPYIVANLYPNNYGGATWGNPGSNGQSSIFGSVVFAGGQGGRRGEILQRVAAVNETGSFAAGDNAVGGTQYNKTDTVSPGGPYLPAPFPNPVLGGQTVQGRTYGIWNPPGIASSQYVLDQVMTIGIINYSQSLVANSAPAGANDNWLPSSGGSGGGGGGGASNNIYSFGGNGGQASFGDAGNNFAYGGGFGGYGGGGGGGGGGEGVVHNNTHDGAPGGNGGAGFIEISWIQ